MTKKIFPVLALVALMAGQTVLAEGTNPKFSWSTELFLMEQQADQQVAGQNAPARRPVVNPQERVIASPNTIDGITYISCFIYLNDPTDLSALRALGVRVLKSFRGLNFITADVPVDQVEALAEIDNVTKIKVSTLAQPDTDVAREKTNVNSVIANTDLSQLRGMTTAFDGSGVVLGVIDDGIDFRHIAFKNADGTSRIVRAYVYDGDEDRLYTEAEMNNPALAPTTDDATADHGTHTSAIAGGSSVIIEKLDSTHYNMSVTNAHDSATYGGMAPGADLYLFGIKGFEGAREVTAIAMMAEYADSVGKPLVINCSWNNKLGPRNGKGEVADVVHAYFGDDHPDRIIVFSSSNQAGNRDENGGGGTYVNKKNASREDPLRTIMRTNLRGGDYYYIYPAVAWSDSALNCRAMVLDNDSGNILWSVSYSYVGWSCVDSVQGYNPDSRLWCYLGYDEQFESNEMFLVAENMQTTVPGAYSLALEIFPVNGTADINLWGYNDNTYFSNYLAHPDPNILWQEGSDDNSSGHEANIDGVISVGAYASKLQIQNYKDVTYAYNADGIQDDIAWFSSYVTPECTVSGQTTPWITAPGRYVCSAGNHYHTPQVDANSYYRKKYNMIVCDSVNPYITMQGTSQATPVTAGIVAQWLQAAQSVGKSLTVNQVKDIMRRTAIHDCFTDGPSAKRFGYGKIDALAGIKLITDNHEGVLELPLMVNNDTTIAQHYDSTTNVMLYNRTFVKNNGWTPFCLPFSLDSTAVTTSPLAGGTLMELDSTRFTLSDTTLTLTFVRVNHIEAGRPYIIKWDTAESIKHPVFSGVTISNTTPIPVTSIDGNVVFHGTYHPVLAPVNDSTKLVVGIKDTLLNSINKEKIVRSCYSYFELKEGTPMPTRIVFNIDYNDTPTNMPNVEPDERPVKFIQNGQMYIRRDGMVYDVLGRRVRKSPTNHLLITY